MIEANLEENQINQLDDHYRDDSCDMDTLDWYKDVVYYLQNMKSPPGLIDNQKIALNLQEIRYVIVQGQLWWRDMQGVLLKCIGESEYEKILKDMHQGVCGGH